MDSRSFRECFASIDLGDQIKADIETFSSAVKDMGNIDKSTEQFEFEDHTNVYLAAVNSLKKGELIKDDSFQLSNSIGAIEIGNDRMDVGMRKKSDLHLPKDLEGSELLKIMDIIFSLEMTWHMGSGFQQTLFSSVHMFHFLTTAGTSTSLVSSGMKSLLLDECLLRRKVLWPFCMAVARCCAICRMEFISGELRSEEDCSLDTMGLNLLENLSNSEVECQLESASKWTLENLSVFKKKEVQYAILGRLQLRWALLRSFSTLEQSSEAMFELIKDINYSQNICMPVANEISDYLESLLASTLPPRPLKCIKLSEACKFSTQILRDMSCITYLKDSKNPLQILELLFSFGEKPLMAPINRTFIQSFLVEAKYCFSPYDGETNFSEISLHILFTFAFVTDNIGPFLICPTEKISQNQALQRFTLFLQSAVTSFTKLLSSQLHNKPRRHRVLQNLISEFEELELEGKKLAPILEDLAEKFRVNIGKGQIVRALSRLTQYWKLHCMIQVVEATIKLDLLQNFELFSAMRYLSYLYTRLKQYIEELLKFADPFTTPTIDRAYFRNYLKFQRNFCEYKALAFETASIVLGTCETRHLISVPRVSTELLNSLYNRRYSTFQNVEYPPFLESNYNKSFELGEFQKRNDELKLKSNKLIGGLKNDCDILSLDEICLLKLVKSILKSCIKNAIEMKKFEAINTDDTVHLKIDFAYSDVIPTITLTE